MDSKSSADPASTSNTNHDQRLGVLDGWRALSILLVLACHMFPLGPRRWNLNLSAGLAGMSLFFTLSGFLILKTLYRDTRVIPFLIRRVFRIVPLAAIGAITYLIVQRKGLDFYAPHLLYYLNYHVPFMTEYTSHYWSLCVEVHFYVLAAILAGLLGRFGLCLLPVIGLFVTVMRAREGVVQSILTHQRVDEILAGCSLALVCSNSLGPIGRSIRQVLRTIHPAIWGLAFVASCLELSGPLQYLRPYLAAFLVGSTLETPGPWHAIAASRRVRYVAEISFALYVVHKLTMFGWFGTGGTVVKYGKRLLSLGLSFGLAHLSTFTLERYWIDAGKRLCRRWDSYANADRKPSLTKAGAKIVELVQVEASV
jgi:peptidoglycan/LPS O-acetylase OafA/YrhL